MSVVRQRLKASSVSAQSTDGEDGDFTGRIFSD